MTVGRVGIPRPGFAEFPVQGAGDRAILLLESVRAKPSSGVIRDIENDVMLLVVMIARMSAGMNGFAAEIGIRTSVEDGIELGNKVVSVPASP